MMTWPWQQTKRRLQQKLLPAYVISPFGGVEARGEEEGVAWSDPTARLFWTRVRNSVGPGAIKVATKQPRKICTRASMSTWQQRALRFGNISVQPGPSASTGRLLCASFISRLSFLPPNTPLGQHTPSATHPWKTYDTRHATHRPTLPRDDHTTYYMLGVDR